jgi:hypothetical protein
MSLGEAEQLNSISDKINSDGKSTMTDKDLADYYNNLDDEEKELFFEINFDEEKTKENWDAIIEKLKEEKLEVAIEAKAA